MTDFEKLTNVFSRFTHGTLLDMNRNVYDFDVYLEDYKINLQRGYVWTDDMNKEYIKYLILTKAPLNCLLIKKDNKYLVIDGKQRLNALLSFYENKFSVTIDDNEYYFKDLQDKHNFTLSPCWIGIVGNNKDLSDKDLVTLFYNINTKYIPQNISHMVNIKNIVDDK